MHIIKTFLYSIKYIMIDIGGANLRGEIKERSSLIKV